MTRGKLNIWCLAAVGVIALALPGCGDPKVEGQTTAQSGSTPALPGQKPPSGGALVDQTLYAAPADVKPGDTTGGAARK
jgi:hypothetical protein